MASRALVLGGGGVTGVAWEIGLLAGLAEGGMELTDADLVVGTSAGAVVGAQVTSGVPLPELYARQLAGYGGELAARLSRRSIATMGWAAVRSREPRTARARIGRLALNTPTVPEAQRRAVIESRLPVHDWPSTRLRVTAVDAESGAFVVFDRDAGVTLVDAVAASCAVPGVWPPVTIDGRRWIDGGMRSSANADLAQGCQRVVVLAPVSGGFGPIARLADQVAALRAGGAQVSVVTPDRDSRRAIGRNMLDPARRAVAARAGHAQAPAAAAEIRDTWS